MKKGSSIVRDPEFEDWLRLERGARVAAPHAPSPRSALPALITLRADPATRRIHVCAEPSMEIAVHWLTQLAADGVARHLRERLSHEIIRSDARPVPGDISLTVDGYRETDRRLGLRIRLDAGPHGEMVWSGMRHLHLRGAPPVDDPHAQQLMIEAAVAVDTAIRTRYGGGDPMASQQEPDMLARAAIPVMIDRGGGSMCWCRA